MLQIKNTLGGSGGNPEGSYVWKKYEATPDPYLSFLGNEEFTLKIGNNRKNWDGTLEYSTDAITWNTWDGTEIPSSGNNLYLRGTGNTKITGGTSNQRFVFTGADTLRISCNGSIETLLDYNMTSAGKHPSMSSYCYAGLFQSCTFLITAPDLPAITLASYCYNRMFRGCTNLIIAPELPATTLADHCYYQMFYKCSSLTTPPSILPAATLVGFCYAYMFEFSALDAIPKIMATTYDGNSCRGMFDDVKTLNVYSTSGTGHTYGWTAPISASGYCEGMFGSDDGASEWAKLDGSNFPNNGTPTDDTTYYFKTVA